MVRSTTSRRSLPLKDEQVPDEVKLYKPAYYKQGDRKWTIKITKITKTEVVELKYVRSVNSNDKPKYFQEVIEVYNTCQFGPSIKCVLPPPLASLRPILFADGSVSQTVKLQVKVPFDLLSIETDIQFAIEADIEAVDAMIDDL